MAEFTLKTNFSHQNFLRENKGFTLIEGILAVAIAAIGLLLILSLIGMSLDINIKSQYRLKEAATINSLADELRSEKDKQADNQALIAWLQEAYPEFVLIESYQTELEGLWNYKLEHNGQNYYISVYGEGNE